MPMYFITGVVNLDLLVKAESVRFLEFKLLVFLLQLTNILGRYFETMNMAFLSYVCSLVLASMQDFCQKQLLMWCLLTGDFLSLSCLSLFIGIPL